jgi:DNA-directed RNA polymerase specialized sigma subunit
MTSKEKIIQLLVSYPNMKRKIGQLRYELENAPKLSDDEVIGSLALGSSLRGISSVNSGRISDKTMTIAMKYKTTGGRMVNEARIQIAQELNSLEQETHRLEHYLSILPENLSAVVRFYYFEKIPNSQIAEHFEISEPTVIHRKKKAVSELTAMYEFLQTVKCDP